MKDTHKQMAVLPSHTVRDLVAKVNKYGIGKDDIVTVLRENETFMLVYYKETEDGKQ